MRRPAVAINAIDWIIGVTGERNSAPALTKAGVGAVLLDGSRYTPLFPDQVTIFSASADLTATICEWLS